MGNDDNNLRWLQRRFMIGAAAILPIAPFLFLQGQVTRWKVGLLLEAAGEKSGRVGNGDYPAKLFVMGESTVAGLGARDHSKALAGQFALHLSDRIKRPVDWKVLGKNGVTARRVIDELVPEMPDEKFDYILLGIGGNDVMKVSSPRKWRTDAVELINIIRGAHPDAVIFITNCPMMGMSPVIPEPTKTVLWRLSQMHNDNIIDFTTGMDRVFYYRQPALVRREGFFADGIHPSEQGYADWSEAMIKYFSENYEW